MLEKIDDNIKQLKALEGAIKKIKDEVDGGSGGEGNSSDSNSSDNGSSSGDNSSSPGTTATSAEYNSASTNSAADDDLDDGIVQLRSVAQPLIDAAENQMKSSNDCRWCLYTISYFLQ